VRFDDVEMLVLQLEEARGNGAKKPGGRPTAKEPASWRWEKQQLENQARLMRHFMSDYIDLVFL
jgi:hypothetical protein